MSAEVASRVEELLVVSGDGMTGAMSLKLLAWPHTDKIREVGFKFQRIYKQRHCLCEKHKSCISVLAFKCSLKIVPISSLVQNGMGKHNTFDNMKDDVTTYTRISQSVL